MKRRRIAACILCAVMMFTGCAGEAENDGELVDDKTTHESVGTTAAGDTDSSADSSYAPYADTDYDTPDNYTTAQNGRQYGEIQEIEYYSSVSHKNKKATVILPYGYDPSESYPVLYVLHGMGGDNNSWLGLEAQYIVQNAKYDYGAADMIVVSPAVFTSQTYGSEDGLSFNVLTAEYDKFAEELVNDLMPLINSTYSVKTGKDNTAIAGYSLGGRESSYIGFKYPDLFGYIGAFSATNGIFKDEVWASAVLKDYDCSSIKDNYRLLLYQVGVDDPYIDGVREFKEMFDEYDVECIYYEMEGGHEGSVWQNGLYNFVRRIFRGD